MPLWKSRTPLFVCTIKKLERAIEFFPDTPFSHSIFLNNQISATIAKLLNLAGVDKLKDFWCFIFENKIMELGRSVG